MIARSPGSRPVASVILLASALLAAGCAEEEPQGWVPVTKGDLVLGVDVTGELRAVDSTPIKPPSIGDVWEFKIAEMAPEGAVVKAGDVVVGFDPSNLMADLQKMMNEAESAAKELDKQRGDSAMARKDQALAIAEAEAGLRKASLKSDAPGDTTALLDARVAELDHQLAEMEVERARAKEVQGRRHDAAALERLIENQTYYRERVGRIQESMARMRVAAPRPGTVVYPMSWRGEKKKVGDGAWRMETVVEIASLDRMLGKGEIDEVDFSKVAGGQRVLLRLDALPDTEIAGRVATIASTVQRQSHTNPSRIVKIDIALEKTDGLPLRPGMRFRGRVETGRVAQAVMVPAEAVFIAAEGPVAYRRSAGGWEKVRLRTGRRNPSAIEVLAGLAPGDEVSRIDLERGAGR